MNSHMMNAEQVERRGPRWDSRTTRLATRRTPAVRLLITLGVLFAALASVTFGPAPAADAGSNTPDISYFHAETIDTRFGDLQIILQADIDGFANRSEPFFDMDRCNRWWRVFHHGCLAIGNLELYAGVASAEPVDEINVSIRARIPNKDWTTAYTANGPRFTLQDNDEVCSSRGLRAYDTFQGFWTYNGLACSHREWGAPLGEVVFELVWEVRDNGSTETGFIQLEQQVATNLYYS